MITVYVLAEDCFRLHADSIDAVIVVHLLTHDNCLLQLLHDNAPLPGGAPENLSLLADLRDVVEGQVDGAQLLEGLGAQVLLQLDELLHL